MTSLSRCMSGPRSRTGFTTLGMIVALVLLGILMSPMMRTIVNAQQTFVSSRQRAEAASNVRYAHLALTRYIRICGSDPLNASVQGIDPDPLNDSGFDDVRLRADYNPPDGDTDDMAEDLTFFVRGDTLFVRDGDGDDEPYLIGVDSLAFEYFDSDGDPITDPDLVPIRARSVQVTLAARSTLRGEPTEHALVGRVRLRNGR